MCSSSLTTIVNVALPSIGHDLHAGVSGLQWIVDAYTLVLASLLMLSGSMADRIGRRRVFAIGLCLFTLGSLRGSLATREAGRGVFRRRPGPGERRVGERRASRVFGARPGRGGGDGGCTAS